MAAKGQVEGKIALVTGGASGIGEACCETLAREGAKVVVTDIDEVRGQQLVARIKSSGGEAMFLTQDVTDEARWIEVVKEIDKAYGRLDVMVSNAGIGILAPIVEMKLADFQRQNAINLDGVFLSAKHCIPLMARSGGGSIIMMSSIAGLRGSAGLGAYSMSKGGVRLFSKSVALECAAAGNNIRCNSVHPGIIETPIWGKIPTGASGAGRNSPIDPNERAHALVPIKKVGQAQDIANGVLFLSSDASSYITGSELVIDGGVMSGSLPRN